MAFRRRQSSRFSGGWNTAVGERAPAGRAKPTGRTAQDEGTALAVAGTIQGGTAFVHGVAICLHGNAPATASAVPNPYLPSRRRQREWPCPSLLPLFSLSENQSADGGKNMKIPTKFRSFWEHKWP